MGLLSLYFKPNFLGLLKCLNKLNWVIVFFSLINLSVCIYEDQIGKFDWRQSYVGRIKFAQFDTVSTAKKLIVATEENVLAALNLKTGQVVWRHVFESTSTGNIQLLHVTDKVVTVSGANPYLVRGWDSTTGVLLWEWSLVLHNEETAEYSEFWVQHGTLVHMLPIVGSHIEVTMYTLWSGSNKGSTSKLPASWVNDGCVLSAPYFTCISGHGEGQLLISLDVTSDAVAIISKPLSEFITTKPRDEVNLRQLDGNSVMPGFLLDDAKIVMLKNNKFEVLDIPVGDQAASVTVVDEANGLMVLQSWTDNVKGFQLTAHSLAGQELPEIQASEPGLKIPEPEIAAALCTKARENVCRLLVNAADDALHLMQQGGRVVWSREEALANVAAAEFVELPVSELDAAIESEFDLKEGSIWSAFSRRLHTQLQQLQALVQNLQKTELSSEEPQELVRDYFNLHKIIVLVTDVGKIFGMDNLSGELLWRVYEPRLAGSSAAVFTQRSARHPPLAAALAVLGAHEETGNALIVSLNPITGELLQETIHLPVRALQCALLHQPDQHKLHALAVLDSAEQLHVFPASAAPLVENMYMYVADKETADVRGYALKYVAARAVAVPTWAVRLGGGGAARVVAAAHKPAWERARSAGAVLGDRSVLYKHVNPNLLALLVQVGDTVLAVALDAVTGAVVSAAVHRRARAMPLAVHMDHAVAYLYYSDKHRRSELASMELYEGKERWVGAGLPWSSWGAARAPAVLRQAYILPAAPAAPVAAANTHTDRSLTDKHVLLALSSGAIIELPWQLLEPRRPLAPTASEREEGLIPYAPELPLPHDAVLNYNRSVARVRRLHAAPAGLESTSLVLATGLDLYYTRVAPSKTFDLLKDDFDYHLITAVLAALLLATYASKHFAARKLLRMAWK